MIGLVNSLDRLIQEVGCDVINVHYDAGGGFSPENELLIEFVWSGSFYSYSQKLSGVELNGIRWSEESSKITTSKVSENARNGYRQRFSHE